MKEAGPINHEDIKHEPMATRRVARTCTLVCALTRRRITILASNHSKEDKAQVLQMTPKHLESATSKKATTPKAAAKYVLEVTKEHPLVDGFRAPLKRNPTIAKTATFLQASLEDVLHGSDE